MSEKSLYDEVKKRKMAALGKGNVVKAVEQHGRVLSIRGQYDKPDKVTAHMYAAVKDAIEPGQFGKIDLFKYDLVVIGCPGNEIPSQYHARFRDYVEQGGWILSTDWVLRTIVEPLFPGFISWNGQKTADAVVSCDIVDPNHPFMHGVVDSLKSFKGKDSSSFGPKTIQGMQPTFNWWLEDKSFPISVLRKNDVKVLIRSYEIEKKWGAGPVFVYFTYGKGVVAHFISHTHLQKGASKGKFASAIIITNILDECIKFKYGIGGGAGQGNAYVDPSSTMGIGSSTSWDQSFQTVGSTGGYNPGSQPASPEFPSGQSYPTYQPGATFMPPAPDPSQGIVPNFGGIAQAVAVSVVQNPGERCPVCDQDFMSYQGTAYQCSACKALYHEECVQQQINYEGTCRKCSQVLLL